MFIDRKKLNQLNKDIFGGGINQTKKLHPDYGRMVMPDPSLPKIKRFNIKSNNPLGYLINANQPMPVQSQVIENVPPQEEEVEPQPEPEQEIISQKISQPQEEEQNNNNIEEQAPEPEEPTTKKFVITDLGENNVILPPGYSTDDEGEFKLINLLNESKDKYKLGAENEWAKIYKREVR